MLSFETRVEKVAVWKFGQTDVIFCCCCFPQWKQEKLIAREKQALEKLPSFQQSSFLGSAGLRRQEGMPGQLSSWILLLCP